MLWVCERGRLNVTVPLRYGHRRWNSFRFPLSLVSGFTPLDGVAISDVVALVNRWVRVSLVRSC